MSETDKPSTIIEERPAVAASKPTAPVANAPSTTPAPASAPGPAPVAAASQPAAAPAPPAQAKKLCLDCGASLEGKYCIACGQRAQLRSLSLPSLAHDAIHDLAHFDSRGWVTLRALLFRPGFLTSEFVQGRRTRYLPPFRLYLVLSLVFFLLLSLKPSEQPLVIGGRAEEAAGVVSGADQEALQQAMQELSKELGDSAATEEAKQEAAKAAAAVNKVVADPGAAAIVDADTDCSKSTWGMGGREWYSPQLQALCEKLKQTSRRELGREVWRNVPKAMFLSLPLLALVNFVLYAFSRRKYVEHLLFYVHYHAFAFLLLTLNILAGLVLGWVGLSFVAGMLGFAAMVYLFVALFKSMRVVYGQSRLMTTFKYLAVVMAYSFFSLITLLATFAYTAYTM